MIPAMTKLKEVSRKEYIKAVKAAGDTIRPHLTEGYSLSVAQWLDVQSDCVRFQATYANGSTKGCASPAIVKYFIEDV